MLTRQIQLHVNQSFALPEVYRSGCVEEVEEALWIGATIQNSVKTRRSNDEVKKISELKDAEISRITTQYNDKLTKVLDELHMITTAKDAAEYQYSHALKELKERERDAVTKEWDEKFRIARYNYDTLSSRYDTLLSLKREVEEARAKDIEDAVKRTESIMEKLVISKAEQLNKMEATYLKLQDIIAKQSDDINKLNTTLVNSISTAGKRNANIKVKGSDYEEEFREKLVRVFGLCQGFRLRDTRLGMGHEMDFSMDIEGNVILWELKNYSAPVPKAEVDKFLRDLKENPQSKIGVMISRNTDIYGKSQSGNMFTEFDDGKMMIYISRFEEFCSGDENRTFQMIASLFRVWWEYGKEESNVLDRAEIIRELERIIEEISKRRTEWRRHKAHMDEITRWTSDLLDESENRLDRILKKVRNTDSVQPGETPIQIPDGVFRESDSEKDQTWIKSIMKVCSCGGQIEVRELVDLLTPHHKLSKDNIRSNVMSIIKDSAVIKKGVIKHIKGISKFVPECQIVF